jgi:hypothetical protein
MITLAREAGAKDKDEGKGSSFAGFIIFGLRFSFSTLQSTQELVL